MYWCIRAIWNPAKLVASTVVEFDDTLPCFTDDRRDSVRVTHQLPGEVFVWKTALGRGRTRPDSLIVIVKGGHSCCLHGSHVSCYQVIFLARWLLIQISVTPSDIGEACSPRSNKNMMTLWFVWGFLDDIGYFVVMAGCYIIYCMSYLCMCSIGC
jgi:hypothetical protein